MYRGVVRFCHAGSAFLLAVVVISAVGLAHASPPDPTWIGGFYDDADYDDAVLALLAIDGLTSGPVVVLAAAELMQPLHAPPLPPTPSPPVEVGHSRSPPPA
jgi:hypothetical protein